MYFIFSQAVTMSSCGNFAITGDSLGHVDIFNIQSGIHRGSVGMPKGLFRSLFASLFVLRGLLCITDLCLMAH